MYFLNQSVSSLRRVPFELFDAAGAPITSATVSFTNPPATGEVQISKAGGGFVDVAGTVIEIGNGTWYYQATTGDVDTLGLLILKVNKATAKVFKYQDEVINAPATSTSLDVVLGLLNQNSVIDKAIYSGANLTSSRIRVFSSKVAALAATLGAADGSDGETQRYLMTGAYTGANLTSYTLVKDL